MTHVPSVRPFLDYSAHDSILGGIGQNSRPKPGVEVGVNSQSEFSELRLANPRPSDEVSRRLHPRVTALLGLRATSSRQAKGALESAPDVPSSCRRFMTTWMIEVGWHHKCADLFPGPPPEGQDKSQSAFGGSVGSARIARTLMFRVLPKRPNKSGLFVLTEISPTKGNKRAAEKAARNKKTLQPSCLQQSKTPKQLTRPRLWHCLCVKAAKRISYWAGDIGV